jgi:hypothetical protein
MPTLLVSPPLDERSAEPRAVEIEILLGDEELRGPLDVIEVWRSRALPEGPYEELTAAEARGARIPKEGGDPPSVPVEGRSVRVSGRTLALRLSSGPVAIAFTDPDSWTLGEVAREIAAQGLGRLTSHVDGQGSLVIETTEVGTGAELVVLPSDAAALLGLPALEPESRAFGRDARIPLSAGLVRYRFADRLGTPRAFYRARLRDRLSGTVGELSLPVGGLPNVAAVHPSHLVLGRLDLIDPAGRPLAGREVRVYASFKGVIAAGRVVAGTDIVGLTDHRGRAEFSLLRGVPVTVAIAGTSLVREVTPPVDPAIGVFPLLGADLGSEEDYFRVRAPDLPFAARRSL